LYDPQPEADEDWWLVGATDASLSKLTPLQAKLVMDVCVAFGLKFDKVLRVINTITRIKGEGEPDVS